jgi:hypothetical protein
MEEDKFYPMTVTVSEARLRTRIKSDKFRFPHKEFVLKNGAMSPR